MCLTLDKVEEDMIGVAVDDEEEEEQMTAMSEELAAEPSPVAWAARL